MSDTEIGPGTGTDLGTDTDTDTDTDAEITADLVRDLLREQHPDLAGLVVREVAGGWGNQMWRLGTSWPCACSAWTPLRSFS